MDGLRTDIGVLILVVGWSLCLALGQDGRAAAVQGGHSSDEGQEAAGERLHRALRRHLLRREGPHEPRRP